MLQRKLYKYLLDWKKSNKKEALFIKGARQVGKTFLVRQFGQKEYESFIEINFLKNGSYKSIFLEDDLSATEIYKRMSAYIPNIKFIPGRTLIFLDEIQVCPCARTAIKFLVEDGQFDIISSGSLLGLSYMDDADDNVKEPSSLPVGYERQIMMYSLDFEEFLWANGYTDEAINYLKSYFDKNTEIPHDLNETYEKLFREYIIVGGMPEVVQTFVNTNNYQEVTLVQNKILSDYQDDISKHAKGAEKIKVRQCYDSIPKQLAKEYRKFQYSVVEKGKTGKKFSDSIKWLCDSCLVNKCINVSEVYIPLLGYEIDDQFKIYLNDTGLLCCMYGDETKLAILNNTIKGNTKGGIYENVIGNELLKKGYKLHYYKKYDSTIEIEFIIEKNGEVLPIEVKSGNVSTPSLNHFIKKYTPSICYKFINGNLGKVDTKKTLPHYMVIFI
ncbi:MAG: ATP-binding protein [Bacilli bacterium]